MTPTEKLDAELEKRLAKEYRKAKRELTVKLQKHLHDFKVDDAINKEKVSNGLMSEDDYKAWREEQIMYSTWARDMRDTIAKDLYSVKQIATDISNDYNVYSFCESVNWETFNIEKDTKMNTSFTLYSKNTLGALLKENPSIMPRRVDKKKDFKWNKRRITSALIQSVLQGESTDQIAKRLRGVVDMNYGESLRTARTMMNSAVNAGKQESFERAKEHGIDMEKVWLAVLDLRTRHSHRHLDMETIDVNERFSNGLLFPGDWSAEIPKVGSEIYNCRCTMITKIKGIDFSMADRDYRLGSMSYDEWKKSREPKRREGGADGSQISDKRR